MTIAVQCDASWGRGCGTVFCGSGLGQGGVGGLMVRIGRGSWRLGPGGGLSRREGSRALPGGLGAFCTVTAAAGSVSKGRHLYRVPLCHVWTVV